MHKKVVAPNIRFAFLIAAKSGAANLFQARKLLALVNLAKKGRCLIGGLF